MVFLFASMEGEVDTYPMMIRALQEGKLVALPRIDGDQMQFHVLPPGSKAVQFEQFGELHPYGFFQPASHLPVIHPTNHLVNIMLVPGLGFDLEGNRLGRGKGYYDRYIARFEQLLHTVGVCFEEQVFPDIPVSDEDKKIRALISDSGILYQKM